MKKFIVISAIVLSACMSAGGSKEKPLLYEDNLVGNHSNLARCVVDRLQADSRWPIRMLRFSNRMYPEVNTSGVYAYDIRLLPGTYARNSPTNPDAVLEYSDPYPEVHFHDENDMYIGPDYVFALKIRRIDDTHVMATLRGNQHVGGIAWESLQACSVSRAQF
jgi:hypothetical protein